MTSMIQIKNADEIPLKRYGIELEPGEEYLVPADKIIAYSLMELSLTVQRMNNKLGQLVRNDTIEHIHTVQDKNSGKPQNVFIQNFPDSDPWIIRQYKKYKERRAFKKLMSARRQSHV